MKSYLSLIPISAKVRRRQNRMTLLCIVLAVFLVTAVFSMADMSIRMEQARLTKKHNSEFTIEVILGSAMGKNIFLICAVLFLCILIAGVLMISGSINSNVAQRTKFFGMMRCIGMSRQQLARFVRLEALNWCKTAIPIGVLLGIVSTWILCAVLRFVVQEEFTDIPLFGVSFLGIASGIVMGTVTVLIAARAPAKRAARVSPIAAVSGNADGSSQVRRGIRRNIVGIDIALGIHHARAAKKNRILMTGSFALSIILFLTFSVLLDFVSYLLPQSAGASDIDINTVGNENCIPYALTDTIRGIKGVKNVYGRRSSFDVPAEFDREGLPDVVDLISFDDFDLEVLKKDHRLKSGSSLSKVYGNSGGALVVCDGDTSLKIGDQVWIEGTSLTVAGMLKYDIFSEDGLSHGRISVITSEETFTRLTGIKDYSLVMIQTTSDMNEETVAAMRDLLGEDCVLQDMREQSTFGTYAAFVLCVYAFLAIIALVTLLNIMNTIAISVSAKSRQYGVMRAVGMDGRQIIRMIFAEAGFYALSGCVIGSAVGTAIGKMLFDILIRDHFAYAVWSLPLSRLLIVVLFVAAATVAAAYAPSKRMLNMAVTETINEL